MQIVPAKNGWLWVTRGGKLFARSPFIWITLMFAFMLLASLLGSIPLVGRALAIAITPLFVAACMGLCLNLEARQPLDQNMLLSGLRGRLAALAVLGVAYFALMWLAFALSALADGGVLLSNVMMAGAIDPGIFDDSAVYVALNIAAAMLSLAGMVYWFAPMLAAFGRMGPGQALFYSCFAALRNWRAYVVYTAGLMAVAMAGGLLLVLIDALGTPDAIVHNILFLLILIFMSLVFASMYPAYRDVFPDPQPAATAQPVDLNPPKA